jgi:hypothetical protein
MSGNTGRRAERDRWNSYKSKRPIDLDKLRKHHIDIVEGRKRQDIKTVMATADRLALDALRSDHAELGIPVIVHRRERR